MWPFKRTLSERYSKLVKLIKSIDSHFQLTEDKEDSLRLHLPNYKGNQPMDFHIYLMGPQIHIFFVTEIEGEKMSVLSYFDQNADQQDMFNTAMMRNLNKMHEVLGKKYCEYTEGKEKQSETTGATDCNQNIAMLSNSPTKEICRQTKLTIEQRYALYFFANVFGGGLYEKEYRDEETKKETLAILKDYQEDLNLTELEVKYISSTDFNLKLTKLFEILHGIKNESEINNLLITCGILANLNWASNSYKDFYKMTQEMGYSEEETKKKMIHLGFKEDSPIICNTQQKGNLPAIVKSWSLLDFAKIHGKPSLTRPIEFMNSKTGESYMARSVAFEHPTEKDEKGRNKVILVGFSRNLGELTVEEIVARKDKLCVVQWDNGNYTLCSCDKETTNEDKSGINVIESRSSEIIEKDLKHAFIDKYNPKYSNTDEKTNKQECLCIEEGTKTIGYCAYMNRYDLISVIIPNSVTEIGDSAFEGCNSLSYVAIPESVKTIGWSAFKNCSNLTSIFIPSSVTKIGNEAFRNCKKLQAITISPSVICIGKDAFSDTQWYNNQQDGLIYVGKVAYSYKGVLSSDANIIIKNGTLGIADFAFYGCAGLLSISIPASMKRIGKNAFQGLTSITIPYGVTHIGDYAFRGCKLTSIDIPSSVISIGHIPFSASHLSSIKVECRNPMYDSRNNCNAIIDTNTNELIIGCNNTTIPFGITAIGSYAFDGCRELKTVIIPSSVISIGDSAFLDCTNLTEIELPEGVQRLEQHTFGRCRKLASVSIPQTMKSIGSYAFEDCEKLRTIKFASIDSLFHIDFGISGSPLCIVHHLIICDKEITNLIIPSNVERIKGNVFRGCQALKYVTIPSSVTCIDDYAFEYCGGLISITLPDKIKSIGKQAFAHCANLIAIYIPKGSKKYYENILSDYKDILVELDNAEMDAMHILENDNVWTDKYGAQYSADRLQLLHIPENIEEYCIRGGTIEICDHAFVNFNVEDVEYSYIVENNLDLDDFIHPTSKLKSVSIPDSVKSIADNAFDYCTKLSIIIIPQGTREKFRQLLPDYEDLFVEGDISTKPQDEEWNNIWEDEFGVKYSADKRKLLKAPNDLTSYKVIAGTVIICDGAFFECINLKTINLTSSVAVIGNFAFYGCEKLTEISFPKSIKKIGENAIGACEGLNYLYIPKGEYARFAGMLPSHWKKIKVSPIDSIMDENGVLYDIDFIRVHFNTKPLGIYSIKPGVKGIDPYAFKPYEWKSDNGKSLKKLILPDSIVIIGAGAFAYNESLEYINIPKNVAFMREENPFAGCSNLHTIEWESHNAIKEGTLIFDRTRTSLIACLGWHYIDSIQQSWSLDQFEKQYGKMQIGEFINEDTGEHFKNCIFTKPNGAHTLVVFHHDIGDINSVEIAARRNDLKVARQESGVFTLYYGDIVIRPTCSVVLPEGLETISSNAFYGNRILEEIKMPKSIEIIGKDAFKGCSSLKTIHIPNGQKEKFARLLPEWNHILSEIREEDDLPF